MSTTVGPTPDRENPSIGSNPKANLGGFGPSTSQTRKLIGGSEMCQRSFGDISNRVSKNKRPDSQLGGFKKLNPNEAVWKSTPQRVVEPHTHTELEFIPEITETEDNTDILPEECRLTNQDISSLVDFWGAWKRPNISFYQPPSSPPRAITLMTPIQEKRSVKLEPVLEELYDLPPPPWE